MHLDQRLEGSSSFVIDLDLCQIRLSHNAAFPWILLIPRQSDLTEIIDLSQTDQHLLIREIALASEVMRDLFSPDKINVASLGNVVPQLHIHVVARYEGDGAWPHPIWNSGVSETYESATREERINQLVTGFAQS